MTTVRFLSRGETAVAVRDERYETKAEAIDAIRNARAIPSWKVVEPGVGLVRLAILPKK